MNIIQFANRIGVSTATVSRAFHEPEKLRPATRDQVLAEARRLKYYPNVAGRVLVRGRFDTIGLVWPLEIEGPNAVFAQRILSELTAAVVEHDQDLLLCPLHRDRPQTRVHAERSIRRGRCDAWLLLYPRRNDPLHAALQAAGRPVVTLMGRIEANKGWKAVVVDQATWIQDALRRLDQSGARHVAFVGCRPDEPDQEERVAAFRKLAPRWVARWQTFAPEWPIRNETLRAWLKRDAPDSIIAVDDLTALKALETGQGLRKRIPEDLQIIGCDNRPESARSAPRLATYDQPLELMARAAVELAMKSKTETRVFQATFVDGGTIR